MKIKLFVIMLSLLFFSCNKDCDTSNLAPKCKEQPPTTELCQANYIRWFFDANSNECQEIEYTGCNIYGFDTEINCEQCKCN
ncbi:MAG: BPTI/Kunitz-type proteinase inhibitor domain-containing protein [Saprospiraceae bacterium]